MEKVLKDGKVAVLVSHGYGAGWSTWAAGDQIETAMFDKRLVEASQAGVTDISEICNEIFGDEYFCTDGWPVSVEWVDQGDRFTIEEYDGNESIQLTSDLSFTA